MPRSVVAIQRYAEGSILRRYRDEIALIPTEHHSRYYALMFYLETGLFMQGDYGVQYPECETDIVYDEWEKIVMSTIMGIYKARENGNKAAFYYKVDYLVSILNPDFIPIRQSKRLRR